MHLSLPLQDIRASNPDFIIVDAGSNDLFYHEPLHVAERLVQFAKELLQLSS